MRKITEKQMCSGCHACYNICPKRCIDMQIDSEGFWYPFIDEEQCVDCGLCKNVCPVLNEYKGKKGQAYACINKDENILMKSSSGGVFTLIAEMILDMEGVVFGAAFDDDLNVCHTEVKSKAELYKIRGSKYLQSNIGDTYKKAKLYLEDNREVLFTGTPCQISGLKAFLGKEYDNLTTQDIICHGVPSPRVWQQYLEYLSKTRGSTVDKKNLPAFRLKQSGWMNFSVKISFNNGENHIQQFADDLYMQAFLKDLCLRESCYNCHSKAIERESDITLADFWGVENVIPEMFDDKGVSLVLVSSPKGQKIFEAISDKMVYKAVDIDEAAKYNPAAYKSCERNKKRDEFMSKITAGKFNKIVNKCTKQNLLKGYLGKIKRIIRKVINNV